MSLVALCSQLRALGIDVEARTIGSALVDEARNGLVAAFLASDATHILFVDDDISGFTAEDVLAMAVANKGVISAACPMRESRWAGVRDACAKGAADLAPAVGALIALERFDPAKGMPFVDLALCEATREIEAWKASEA